MLAYKLNAPIIGSEDVPTGLHVVQIEAGEVLSVLDTAKFRGSVRAKIHGRTVTVYLNDLREQADQVEIEDEPDCVQQPCCSR